MQNKRLHRDDPDVSDYGEAEEDHRGDISENRSEVIGVNEERKGRPGVAKARQPGEQVVSSKLGDSETVLREAFTAATASHARRRAASS